MQMLQPSHAELDYMILGPLEGPRQGLHREVRLTVSPAARAASQAADEALYWDPCA